ncbi:MAG: transketolase family protein [Promethearchaeota archaeon]
MAELSFRDTFGKFLADNGDKYKKMVVLDSDLSTSTRTSIFKEKYPNRFFNMGVAEQNMLGAALGFAISGKVPIVSGFSIFTTGRAWEFIRLACHDNLDIKIITTHGGIVGEDGSTHNALEDLSLMATLPHLNVLVPSDNIELKSILSYSLNEKGPYFIRIPRSVFPLIHDISYKFSLGAPDVLKDGDDIALLGSGYGSNLAFHSVEEIEKKLKISIKIVNLPSIKPINKKLLINEIKTVKGIITLEEHNIYCGFGSIISRIISDHTPKPIKSIGIHDEFVLSGIRSKILNAYGLTIENIIKKIRDIIKSV